MIMIILLLVLVFLIGFFTLNSYMDSFSVPLYNGLILFDIDGTLTTGTENEKVVQYYIDKGYAVGIATAGAIYSPKNLLGYDWMPRNLYDWMKANKFNTFNNVGSYILKGKYDPESYSKSMSLKPSSVFWPGWSKGMAMESTGKLYETTNIILFDNDPSYIDGVHKYNKNLRVICAGYPCGTDTLSMKSIPK